MIHNIKASLLFAFIFTGFYGCSGPGQGDLIGQWAAHKALEENLPLEVDPSDIRFEFSEDGKYQFFGTLNYREAGSYYLEKGLLYTLDTVNQESIEKVVQIDFVAADTIQIQMQSNGKSRLLELSKTQ